MNLSGEPHRDQLHRFQYRSAASIEMIRNVRLENTAITYWSFLLRTPSLNAKYNVGEWIGSIFVPPIIMMTMKARVRAGTPVISAYEIMTGNITMTAEVGTMKIMRNKNMITATMMILMTVPASSGTRPISCSAITRAVPFWSSITPMDSDAPMSRKFSQLNARISSLVISSIFGNAYRTRRIIGGRSDGTFSGSVNIQVSIIR